MLSPSCALPGRSMRVICSSRYSGQSARVSLIRSTSSWRSRLAATYRGVQLLTIRSMAPGAGSAPGAMDFSCPVVERERWRDYLVGDAGRVLVVRFVTDSGASDAPPLAGSIP